MSDNWRDRSACLEEDPEMFAVNDRESRTKQKAEEIAEAKKVCARCEVTSECLQRATDLGIDAWGVWGGLSDSERARLAVKDVTRRPNPPTVDERCGSYPGSQAHRRRNESLCDDCKDARNDYEAPRKRARRAAVRAEKAA